MNRFGILATGAATFVLVACVLAYIALIAAFGGSPLSAFAYGNGDGTSNTHTTIGTPVPFSQNYSVQLQGDYVAAGVGMRASGPPGGGTVTLPSVPSGSTIVKAFLYWAVVNSTNSPAHAQGSINGNAIVGTNYGTTASPCWDSPVTRQIYTFVADVTPYATFSSNTLTGFNSGGPPLFPPTEPLLEGASLVVVYENSSSAAHQVDIYQGATSFSGPPPETLTMSGFNAVAGSSQTTWVVADGQPDASLRNKTYVDGSITQADTLDGSDGDFWDTNTQDVTADVPPGDTSIQVGAESTNDFGAFDCITWVAQALSTPVSSTTLEVEKVYSPAGPTASVPVSVTCTTGSVSPASGSAAPGSPFVTTVIGFDPGTTCTATETVPAGYTESSNCTNVSISNGVPASCTITNTETTPTPTPGPVGGIVDIPVTPAGESGGGTALLAFLALAAAAVGLGGAAFGLARRRN